MPYQWLGARGNQLWSKQPEEMLALVGMQPQHRSPNRAPSDVRRASVRGKIHAAHIAQHAQNATSTRQHAPGQRGRVDRRRGATASATSISRFPSLLTPHLSFSFKRCHKGAPNGGGCSRAALRDWPRDVQGKRLRGRDDEAGCYGIHAAWWEHSSGIKNLCRTGGTKQWGVSPDTPRRTHVPAPAHVRRPCHRGRCGLRCHMGLRWVPGLRPAQPGGA